MKLEIGIAQWCCAGETVCGDAYTVIENNEVTTISVIDGLGHGEEAAVASQAFVRSLEERIEENDLSILMESASKDISDTRGAQAVILRIDTEKKRLEFLGIGNVELTALAKEPIRPISMSGIIGRRIRKMRQFDYAIARGDLIAVFSDGISSRFELSKYRGLNGYSNQPQELAEIILEKHGRRHDDATCLIISCVE